MNNLALLNDNNLASIQSEKFEHLKTHYDSKYRAGWFLMKASPRPCVTSTLLNNISSYFEDVRHEMNASKGEKYDYLILGSDIEGIFSLGGDLDMFTYCYETKNHAELLKYAIHCIDILYQNVIHYNLDMTSISLVQGDALGGGFEAALSCNVIIAEEDSKLGLPEVLFNMFPGMGAFPLLSQKIGPVKAEKMILSGKIYTAEEMHQMGVIDYLAKKGEGELAVYNYIKSANRSNNTHHAMRRIKDIHNKIHYDELLQVTKMWVDSVFKMNEKDIRMMQRLINKQNSRVEK